MMIRELDPDVYLSRNFVVLDFETTNLEKGNPMNLSNSIVLTCWTVVRNGIPEKKWGSSIGALKALQSDIETTDFLVCHNAQFELKWMKRMGLDLTNLTVFCTMMAEYVIGGNRYNLKQLALDAIGRRRKIGGKANLISQQLKMDICPSTMDRVRLTKYGLQDVSLTHRLFHIQREQLIERKQLHLAFQRSMMSITLADIAFTGLYLDKQVVYTRYEEEKINHARAWDELMEISDINWNSHPQKREFIYGELGFETPKDHKGDPILTDAGLVTTKTEHLLDLVPETNLQHAFLDIWVRYAKANARLTKTLQFFKGVCDQRDGHFYGNINQGTSATHRLTSTGQPIYIEEFEDEKSAQLQNIERLLKPCLDGGPGFLVGDTDAASIEMRVAVELAGDAQGYRDLVSGHDPHRFSASEMLRIPMDRVTKDQRQDAKSDTFKPLYYGRSGTPEQRRYYRAFRERHPDIDATQEEWIDTVLKTKKLRLPYGMEYYWKDAGWKYRHNQICNYPVQGFATAEIVPLSVCQSWAVMKESKLESHLCNTVHDSVVGRVHPDEQQEFTEITQKAMVDDMYSIVKKLYDYEITVPLGAETQIGEHWGEGDEIKHEVVTPPFTFVPRRERLEHTT
jgi:DNA polymerase-1